MIEDIINDNLKVNTILFKLLNIDHLILIMIIVLDKDLFKDVNIFVQDIMFHMTLLNIMDRITIALLIIV